MGWMDPKWPVSVARLHSKLLQFSHVDLKFMVVVDCIKDNAECCEWLLINSLLSFTTISGKHCSS